MNTTNYQIVPLPKEQWKDTVIPMRYTTEEYYDVDMKDTISLSINAGWISPYPIIPKSMISRTSCTRSTGRKPMHGALSRKRRADGS